MSGYIGRLKTLGYRLKVIEESVLRSLGVPVRLVTAKFFNEDGSFVLRRRGAVGSLTAAERREKGRERTARETVAIHGKKTRDGENTELQGFISRKNAQKSAKRGNRGQTERTVNGVTSPFFAPFCTFLRPFLLLFPDRRIFDTRTVHSATADPPYLMYP